MNSENAAILGANAYSKLVLAIYDALVIRFENTCVWKCPSHHMLDFYNRHVSNRHLDVGVGTGYYLDRCHFPSPHPMIALVDLNPNSLQFASRRIGRYRPTVHHANVLEPLQLDQKFDSIGMSYLLHCLPGNLLSKSIVFDHLKPFLKAGGVLFGSTIVSGKGYGWLAKCFTDLYNSRLIPNCRVMNNRSDTLADLETVLKENFGQHTIEAIGHVALFAAQQQMHATEPCV